MISRCKVLPQSVIHLWIYNSRFSIHIHLIHGSRMSGNFIDIIEVHISFNPVFLKNPTPQETFSILRYLLLKNHNFQLLQTKFFKAIFRGSPGISSPFSIHQTANSPGISYARWSGEITGWWILIPWNSPAPQLGMMMEKVEGCWNMFFLLDG